jgi:hypothetical protein
LPVNRFLLNDLARALEPDETFMRQVGRTLTMADAAVCRVLICDRDTKWSGPFRRRPRLGALLNYYERTA